MLQVPRPAWATQEVPSQVRHKEWKLSVMLHTYNSNIPEAELGLQIRPACATLKKNMG